MSTTWAVDIKKFPKLPRNIDADVCIIGGGLAGVWTAYLLSKEGKRVVLIEKHRIASGETMNTTAWLTHDIDTDLSDLESMYGKKTAQAIWEAHKEAIDMVEATVKAEGIECEFERAPVYVYAKDDKEYDMLSEEADLAKEYGFDAVMHKKTDFGFETAGAFKLKNQAKYHPTKFLRGLLDAAVKNGVEVFELTEATEINGEAPLEVETKDGQKIRASSVVVATYQPLNNTSTHFKKGMYTSYVYELSIGKGVIENAMFMDMKNPYRYMRVDADTATHDRVIVGGEDHRAELDPLMESKSFKALKEYIDETLKGVPYEVVSKWRGSILEPSDGLALIGEIAPNQYVASAFSGNGMTYAPISAMINTDLIMGRANDYAAIFEAKRPLDPKALAIKARDYGEEFFEGAGQNIFK